MVWTWNVPPLDRVWAVGLQLGDTILGSQASSGMWYCSPQGAEEEDFEGYTRHWFQARALWFPVEMWTSSYFHHHAAFSVNSSEPPNKPCPYTTSVMCFTTAMRKNCGGLDIPKRLRHWDTWSPAGGTLGRSLGVQSTSWEVAFWECRALTYFHCVLCFMFAVKDACPQLPTPAPYLPPAAMLAGHGGSSFLGNHRPSFLSHGVLSQRQKNNWHRNRYRDSDSCTPPVLPLTNIKK